MNNTRFETLKLKPDDVLVLHTAVPMDQAAANDLELQLRAAYGWKGILLVLGPGESLQAMPEAQARRYYEALRQHLEKPKLVVAR